MKPSPDQSLQSPSHIEPPQLSLGFLRPLAVLAVFTVVMLLTYFDRGALAASLDLLEEQIGLNETQGGLLGTVFMIGYVVSSPLFAWAADGFRPLYLMAAGLLIWCGSVVATAFAFQYPLMVAARSVTGIGEASFLCLAPVACWCVIVLTQT